MKPIDPSIRSAYTELLRNEAAVKEWWDTKVEENKKNLWLSARAIHRNWKNSTKPKPPRKNNKSGGRGAVLTEEEIRERSAIKPSKEAMEAKQRAEAEAEAKRLEDEQPDVSAERRALENEVADLRAENETLKAGLATPTAPADSLVQALAQAVEALDRAHGLTNQIDKWPDKMTKGKRERAAKDLTAMLKRLRNLRDVVEIYSTRPAEKPTKGKRAKKQTR
jgi:hypothetical protein